MKNATLLFLIPACFFVHSLKAQDTRKPDTTRYYNHPFFWVGYQRQQFDNLNARVRQVYPRNIPQNLIAFGYGCKTGAGALAVQSELSAAFGINGREKEGTTMAGVFGVNVDLGLFLNPPSSVRIYPFAGIAGDAAVVSASISSKNIYFDSIMANPATRTMAEPVSFTSLHLSWRAGLAIDIGNKKNGSQPYNLGLRIVYKQGINEPDWSFNNRRGFAGSPSDRLKQWTASLVIYGPTR
jgi:hypothetical protein